MSTAARQWAFAPYLVMSAVHVTALAIGADDTAAVTKLFLMPLLAAGAIWVVRRLDAASGALLGAIALSWLGDGAATFFPFAPTVPAMLLCFGAAHLCYLVLFTRYLARRRIPRWALVYAGWWVVMMLAFAPVFLPTDVALYAGIAGYGLLLGATATMAARCTPAIALGGALFLCSDTILAFRLFVPAAMPDLTSPLVMLTYCLGQFLLVAGSAVLLLHRRRRPA